jgi:DNA-binding LacI/PurR family transcriptional regulator
MMAKQKPVVVFNRRLPEVPSILVDNARGVRRAVEHLAGLGHGSITYVAGPESSWTDGARWQALREATYELDIRLRRLGPCNSPTVQAGFARAGEIAAHGATAVVAFNDVVAIGVVKGLRRLGLVVPDDVSVVGFDNTLLAEITEPELTTVAAPLHAMGATGVRNLVAMVGGAVPSREPLLMPVRLVVRGSTGQRNRKRTSPAFGTTNAPASASADTSMDAGST